MSRSIRSAENVFLGADGALPTDSFWDSVPALLPADPVAAALQRLTAHPRHRHDLRSFQSVREALEALRQELVGGSDLPTPDPRSLRSLLAGLAEPPRVDPLDIPVPAPTPLPDAAALAAAVLDLALGGPTDQGTS